MAECPFSNLTDKPQIKANRLRAGAGEESRYTNLTDGLENKHKQNRA